jgi:hypothetical protein
MTTIFTSTCITANDGWSGYSTRHFFANSVTPRLTNPGFNTGLIRVSVTLDSSTSGATLDAGWVGAGISSPDYDFDGSQVQLLFGGSTSRSGLSGAQTIASDFVPFTFNFSTAFSMVCSFHWSGTVGFLANGIESGCCGDYLLQAAGTEGQSVPSGTWTAWGSAQTIGVSLIEFISSFTLQSQACM